MIFKNKYGIIKKQKRKIGDIMKMIAHRGYSKYELENTKEAFLAAANRSYFGVESDIVLLKDHTMVLFHDDDLVRLVGDDRKIRDLTFDEAMQIELNANGTYHTYKYHLSTPLEFIRICKHYNKYPIIEFKWGVDEETIDRVFEILYEEDMYDKSMVISFTLETIIYIKNKYPNYPIQLLLGTRYSEEIIDYCLKEGISVDLRWDLVTKELVDRFHEKGLEVNVWTVDSEEIREKMKEFGVDYITTNILE